MYGIFRTGHKVALKVPNGKGDRLLFGNKEEADIQLQLIAEQRRAQHIDAHLVVKKCSTAGEEING
jgi:hypothetical protein